VTSSARLTESPFRLVWELAHYRPGRFALAAVGWGTVHALPAALGLLVARVFDLLTAGAAVGDGAAAGNQSEGVWWWVLAFGLVALGRNVVIYGADLVFIDYWHEQILRLQRNLLRWLLEADGSRPQSASSSEAVSTFRDDVEDLVAYVEDYIDLGGIVLFAAISFGALARIDLGLTLLIMALFAVVVASTQRLGPQIRDRRRRMRMATEAVTGLVGETFGAVQTVKLAGAQAPLLDEFERRNARRRQAALSDTIFTELLIGLIQNMATVVVALVLLAGGLGQGGGSGLFGIGVALTVGELTAFLVLLPRLTWTMSFVGNAVARHRRAGVAYERVHRLAFDAPDEALLDRTPLPLDGNGPGPGPTRAAVPLERLTVTDLTVRFDVDVATERTSRLAQVGPVAFELERGSFNVLVGRVGSGKSTILRGLLGLVPAEGEVAWNGEPVTDRASFLVPPCSAYTPQLPRLFSDTLAYNILLGSDDAAGLHHTSHLAVLDADLPRLQAGYDTMVGARGVKLSGGQIQRTAVARMLATNADLLVFDDLSSALDLHTEAELWRRLFEDRDVTCLVVSHRPSALERADQILVVEQGRLVDRGRLPELLDRSDEIRALWQAGQGPPRAG
jgi:ATP-binding cassette subfamily B protein/ATP-binding cassette subfamily C protein